MEKYNLKTTELYDLHFDKVYQPLGLFTSGDISVYATKFHNKFYFEFDLSIVQITPSNVLPEHDRMIFCEYFIEIEEREFQRLLEVYYDPSHTIY